MIKRELLYVSDAPPKPGPGSSVIVDRHLQRLQHWTPSVLVTQPFRESRWPIEYVDPRVGWVATWAARSAMAYRWQIQRVARHITRSRPRPEAVLNIFGRESMLAAALAKRWNVPLVLLLHDFWEIWNRDPQEAQCLKDGEAHRILRQAARVWSVSNLLGAHYGIEQEKNFGLLPPICEGYRADSQPVNHAPLTVAFAGSLHIYHIEPLRALATALAHVQGQLLLVAQRDNPHLTKILLGLDNIEVQAPFRTNPEVLEFLAQRATALIVPYSFDLVLAPNVVTSFPSKLVEFVHLGLPILIFSPPQTALGLWARERKWSLFWSEPNEANLVAMLKHLQNPAQWEKLAAETRVAQAEFDPDHLHQRFEQDLNEVALSWG